MPNAKWRTTTMALTAICLVASGALAIPEAPQSGTEAEVVGRAMDAVAGGTFDRDNPASWPTLRPSTERAMDARLANPAHQETPPSICVCPHTV